MPHTVLTQPVVVSVTWVSSLSWVQIVHVVYSKLAAYHSRHWLFAASFPPTEWPTL